MDILLVFACLYMAYVNVTTLVKIPLAQWGVMQYAMVVLTLLLVVVGGLKARQFYNKKKAKNAEASAKAILLQAAEPEALEEDDFDPADDDWEQKTADFNYTLVGPDEETKS